MEFGLLWGLQISWRVCRFDGRSPRGACDALREVEQMRLRPADSGMLTLHISIFPAAIQFQPLKDGTTFYAKGHRA
jgi:hypothetical protein